MTRSTTRPALRLAEAATTNGRDPALIDAAMARHRQGDLAAARALYRRILDRHPAHLDAMQLLGAVEYQSGRFESASRLLRRAALMAPGAAGVHCNLGLALQGLGRFEEALACQDRALALQPGFAAAFNNRGTVLRDLHRLEDAAASFEQAVSSQPDFAEAWHNLGGVMLDLKRPAPALECLMRSLRLNPDNAPAANLAGIALARLNRARDALPYLERALRLMPDDAETHFWRGNALLDLERHEEAAASYRHASRLRPDLPETHYNLGTALLAMLRHEEALAAFDRALALRPGYVEALYNRGGALQDMGRHEAAATDYERVMDLSPGHRYALGKLFHCRQYCADWSRHAEHVAAIVRSLDRGAAGDMPLPFLAVSHDPALQLRCAGAYTSNRYPASATPLWNGECYRHDRIRIAYVSADFRDHPVCYLLAGTFEAHDKACFETTAISLRPPDGSAMGRRVAAAFERFVDASRLTDAEVAALMRELEVDIAVDLTGYTQDNRTAIFAARPAPVQINYLGFPGSMGTGYMDYVIADAFVIPPAARPHYAEQVVHMPHCFQGNDDRREIAAHRPGRAEAGLPGSGFVFCAFNTVYKINPPMFDVWMRLLRAVPGSVLWLAADAPAVRRNLAAEAPRRGVEPGRLVFSSRVPYREHLARMGLADLFLDTLPFNAGTTASDALWAGLPLVTCAGEAFAARMAGSLLTTVGLPELVTRSLDDYEALAMKLATTPALLAELRARLWSNRTTSPLFDTKQFCRHLETAYRSMWERQQRGEPPADFRVAPDFTNRCGIDS